MEIQQLEISQDPVNEHTNESSSVTHVEARVEVDTDELPITVSGCLSTVKNLSHYQSLNAEGKTSDNEGKDAADVPQSKAEIEREDLPDNNIVRNCLGEVNMEATITADDVLRAGGFGATDDISSFLPVAVDSTDFEASLRNARDYEEAEGEVSRPGLGWSETSDTA